MMVMKWSRKKGRVVVVMMVMVNMTRSDGDDDKAEKKE